MNRLDQLFLDLSHYVGEGVMTEEMEDRIIHIEEVYRETEHILTSDLILLRELLKKLEGD